MTATVDVRGDHKVVRARHSCGSGKLPVKTQRSKFIVKDTLGKNTSASSGLPSKLPSLRKWAVLKPYNCFDTLINVSCLDCLYTWQCTVASFIESTWQWHLNVTVIPGELARSECSESGGLPGTLRIQNVSNFIVDNSLCIQNTQAQNAFHPSKTTTYFLPSLKLGIQQSEYICILFSFTLKFCFGCPMMFFIRPKHVAMFGDRGSTVVKVLCHKSEGRWFDSRWCHWNLLVT